MTSRSACLGQAAERQGAGTHATTTRATISNGLEIGAFTELKGDLMPCRVKFYDHAGGSRRLQPCRRICEGVRRCRARCRVDGPGFAGFEVPSCPAASIQGAGAFYSGMFPARYGDGEEPANQIPLQAIAVVTVGARRCHRPQQRPVAAMSTMIASRRPQMLMLRQACRAIVGASGDPRRRPFPPIRSCGNNRSGCRRHRA